MACQHCWWFRGQALGHCDDCGRATRVNQSVNEKGPVVCCHLNTDADGLPGSSVLRLGRRRIVRAEDDQLQGVAEPSQRALPEGIRRLSRLRGIRSLEDPTSDARNSFQGILPQSHATKNVGAQGSVRQHRPAQSTPSTLRTRAKSESRTHSNLSGMKLPALGEQVSKLAPSETDALASARSSASKEGAPLTALSDLDNGRDSAFEPPLGCDVGRQVSSPPAPTSLVRRPRRPFGRRSFTVE